MSNPEIFTTEEGQARRNQDTAGWTRLVERPKRLLEIPEQEFEAIGGNGEQLGGMAFQYWKLLRKLILKAEEESDGRFTLEELMRSPSVLDFGMGWGRLGKLLSVAKQAQYVEDAGVEKTVENVEKALANYKREGVIVGVEKNERILEQASEPLLKAKIYDRIIRPTEFTTGEGFEHIVAIKPTPKLLYDLVLGVDHLPLTETGKVLIITEIPVFDSNPYRDFKFLMQYEQSGEKRIYSSLVYEKRDPLNVRINIIA